MILIKKLEAFEPGTELLLFPYSVQEFHKFDADELLRHSREAYAFFLDDRLLCYAGVVQLTLLSPPHLWVLLGRVTSIDMRWFKNLMRLLRKRFPSARTIIEEGYSKGERLARFCGFVPLPEFISIGETRFQYYGVN